MNLNRREFIRLLGLAGAAGLFPRAGFSASDDTRLYDMPAFGNARILHFTDCHAQLNPIYFREPNVNLGIGGAFGKIVSSFVADVLMPPLGLLLGKVDFSDLGVTLQAASEGAEAVTLRYGVFVQTVVDFIIIAFAIFMVVKAMNTVMKKEEEAPPAPPKPSKEEELLTEIRDALQAR